MQVVNRWCLPQLSFCVFLRAHCTISPPHQSHLSRRRDLCPRGTVLQKTDRLARAGSSTMRLPRWFYLDQQRRNTSRPRIEPPPTLLNHKRLDAEQRASFMSRWNRLTPHTREIQFDTNDGWTPVRSSSTNSSTCYTAIVMCCPSRQRISVNGTCCLSSRRCRRGKPPSRIPATQDQQPLFFFFFRIAFLCNCLSSGDERDTTF